jgi:ferritin-like metal-binding protein YciE
MTVESMRELYRHLLAEAYDAERHALMLLDAMETEMSAPDARDRIRSYRGTTARQLETLERAMELLGGACPSVTSAAMQGVRDDRRSLVSNSPPAAVLETYDIVALGRAAELGSAAYRALAALAGVCGQSDARRLFERAIAEEEEAVAWCASAIPVAAAAASVRRAAIPA